jgi:hypothetical protein
MKLRQIKARIEIPENHEICEICSGFGRIGTKTTETKPISGKDYTIKDCPYCNGYGYVNWITKIFPLKKDK